MLRQGTAIDTEDITHCHGRGLMRDLRIHPRRAQIVGKPAMGFPGMLRLVGHHLFQGLQRRDFLRRNRLHMRHTHPFRYPAS
jgi:hypothetical protein